MKQHLWGFLAAFAVLMVLGDAPAWAQQRPQQPPKSQTPTYNPAFSPYLNLLRRGNSTFYNYYGLVLPEVETRKAVGQLQQDTNMNRQAIAGLAQQQQQLEQNQTSNLPDTGSKGVGFFTHTKWFGGSRR